jgi:hypothetical protein
MDGERLQSELRSAAFDWCSDLEEAILFDLADFKEIMILKREPSVSRGKK